MRLRTRLVLALGVVVAVVGVAGYLVPRTVEDAQLGQVDDQLEAVLPTALAQQVSPLRPPGGTGPFAAALTDVYVAGLAADGTRVVYVQPGIAGDDEPQQPSTVASLTPVPAPTAGTSSVPSSPWRLEPRTVGSVRGDGRWRAVVIPAPQQDPDGTPMLVAVSLDRVDATATRLRVAVLVAGGVVLAVVLLAGWWITRLGLRPIADVTTVADAIAAGERQRRVAEGRPGTEAAHLARAFNVMLDERQASEDRLRQFVSDASHELRTPLASIRGFTDLFRQGALEDDQLRDAMRRIGQESRRMGALVDDLLLLARLDEGRPLERSAVDLSSVLRDAVFDAAAAHPTRSLDAAVPDGLAVVGDESRIRQVVANLVTNALVHNPTPASVTVRGAREPGVCVVEVADTGAGMNADERAHAFERFWRADASRARTAGGSGLGLPIVRAIVEAHGGHVSLDTTPGGGTTVRVTLPVEGAAPPGAAPPGAASSGAAATGPGGLPAAGAGGC